MSVEGYKIWIIASFLLALGFGAPFWLSTSVYRAPLPFDSETAISQDHIFHSRHLKFPFPLLFDLHFDQALTINADAAVKDLNIKANNLPKAINVDGFVITRDYKFQIFKTKKIDRHGHYLISCKAGSTFDITVGQDRIIEISLPQSIGQVQSVVNILLTIVDSMLQVETELVIDTLTRKSFHTVKYHPEFKLVFLLINGNSENEIYEWEISKLMSKDKLGRFVDRLANFTRLSLSAQIHEYGDLNFEPEKMNNGTEYYIRSEKLPVLVNTAEWQLTSPTAKIPELAFILYVPSKTIQPLYIIKDDKSTKEELNAILMPRSGGMVVLSETISNVLSLENTLDRVGSIWLQQLRSLLGIEEVLNPTKLKYDLQKLTKLNANVSYIQSSDCGITDFEYDLLLRVRAAETAYNAVNSLHSLHRMLSKLSNMVVGDHIQVMVTDSLKYLKKATMLLDEPEVDFEKVFVAAKQAFLKAEKAFFDPSMTSMLYFPSEHLIAVYLPFFFPVLVPYFSSYFRYFKERKTVEIIE